MEEDKSIPWVHQLLLSKLSPLCLRFSVGVAGELCLVRHPNHPGCKHHPSVTWIADTASVWWKTTQPLVSAWCLGDAGTGMLIMLSPSVTSVLSLLCTAGILWTERDVWGYGRWWRKRPIAVGYPNQFNSQIYKLIRTVELMDFPWISAPPVPPFWMCNVGSLKQPQRKGHQSQCPSHLLSLNTDCSYRTYSSNALFHSCLKFWGLHLKLQLNKENPRVIRWIF